MAKLEGRLNTILHILKEESHFVTMKSIDCLNILPLYRSVRSSPSLTYFSLNPFVIPEVEQQLPCPTFV